MNCLHINLFNKVYYKQTLLNSQDHGDLQNEVTCTQHISLKSPHTKIDVELELSQKSSENLQPHLFYILLRLLPPCKQISSRSGV